MRSIRGARLQDRRRNQEEMIRYSVERVALRVSPDPYPVIGDSPLAGEDDTSGPGSEIR
jgi:hypothetical protein